MRGDVVQRRDRAIIALDRDHARGAERQQRAGEAAGTGTDLEHRGIGKRRCGARNAFGEIEVEQEILAERLLRLKTVAANDIA